MKTFLYSFSLLFILSTFAIAEGFSYNVPVGAEWCGLAAENAPCCEGKEQSPINIVTTEAKYDMHLPRLDFDYPRKCTLELINNGHTVQANVPAGAGKLKIGDKEYELVQFHFHAPSEHTLDDEQYPMEMHLVHKSAEGELAVVGVLIEAGAKNLELSKVWEALPKLADESTTVESLRLKKLLPCSKGSYRYSGSLTTPPCSEGVAWNVLTKPITMSQAQIDRMKALFSGEHFPEGNARPVQPLQGREVATDVKP